MVFEGSDRSELFFRAGPGRAWARAQARARARASARAGTGPARPGGAPRLNFKESDPPKPLFLVGKT